MLLGRLHTPNRISVRPVALAFAVITALLCFIPHAHTAVVVQWGGDPDIVTSFVNINLNSDSASLATKISPNTGGANGYYAGGNPADRSTTFFGSLYNGDTGFSRLQMPDTTPVSLNMDWSSNGSNPIAGLYFWQKGVDNSFLSGTNTITSHGLNLTLVGNVNGAINNGEVRFVLRQDADFYISNAINGYNGANLITITHSSDA